MKTRWKRCIEVGVLLLMMAWSIKIGLQQEARLREEQSQQEQQERQSGQMQQLQQAQQIPSSEQEQQTGQDSDSTETENSDNVMQKTFAEDDDFYVQCLQNLHQGNSMVYADGYYYFRSQTENYSLCRTEGTGMPVEVIADQIPGSIYVRGDQVYFINVSDNRTLYLVGADGSGLRKLSDFPMQELVVVGDRVYFRSVYDREYDPFYQMTEEAAEDDRYLYSMKLDGSDCKLLVPRLCLEFVVDGEQLYYLVYDALHDAKDHYILYKNNLDGTDEEKVFQCENRIWDMLPYQGSLYWVDSQKKQLMRLNTEGKTERLASNVWRFTISEAQAYVINGEHIRRVSLVSGKDKLLTEREREDTSPWHYGADNRGMFLVNGQLFVRYFESKEKGVLWHIWDDEEKRFVVFEDMEPMAAEDLVLDTSLTSELLFYYPGREEGETKKYLDVDGEQRYEESYGMTEGGRSYGDFSIVLPKFNSNLASYAQMNRQMDALMELAMEDKDDFFQEISEMDDSDYCYNWRRYHGYYKCYVGEKYISMYYFRGGYEGGFRDWRQSLPLIFDRETGALLHIDDLFTVEKNFYMKRLTGAIYKYCEMTGMDQWNDAFDNNVLVKNLGELECYLTPDGIVLCYERYAIQAGVSGSPTFEIPYEWFEDIFRQ